MMSNTRLTEFLQETHLLDLATITPEGFPHVTPVWFDYDREHFLISTTKTRKKARNLAQNPNAGFSIAPPELAYKAVVGYGTVQMEDDPDGTLIEKLCYKYLPPDKAGKYFASIQSEGGERIIVTLTPTWMTSWEG
jgi:PPOX class probable F420-dependent enzyme